MDGLDGRVIGGHEDHGPWMVWHAIATDCVREEMANEVTPLWLDISSPTLSDYCHARLTHNPEGGQTRRKRGHQLFVKAIRRD